MSAVPYDYDLYFDRLDGIAVDWPRNQAMPGFYRHSRRDGTKVGVAIWLGPTGRPTVKYANAPAEALDTSSREAEWCEQMFAWICNHPVSQEQYMAWRETGRWHDDVPEAQVDRNAEPHVVVKETVADLLRQANAWLAEIGGAVVTQAQADLAANYADRFGELAKEADATRAAEKKPHLDAGRDCDARWKPVEDEAKQAKRWAAGLLDGFLKAERARKLAAAAQAASGGQPVHAADLKVKAGTRGRTASLRKHKEPRFTDVKQTVLHYAQQERFYSHPNIMNVIGSFLRADSEAGVEVPGAAMVEIETAA